MQDDAKLMMGFVVGWLAADKVLQDGEGASELLGAGHGGMLTVQEAGRSVGLELIASSIARRSALGSNHFCTTVILPSRSMTTAEFEPAPNAVAASSLMVSNKMGTEILSLSFAVSAIALRASKSLGCSKLTPSALLRSTSHSPAAWAS